MNSFRDSFSFNYFSQVLICTQKSLEDATQWNGIICFRCVKGPCAAYCPALAEHRFIQLVAQCRETR